MAAMATRSGSWLADNGDDLTYVLLCRPQVALDFLPELKRYPHIGRLYYGADLHFDGCAAGAGGRTTQHCARRPTTWRGWSAPCGARWTWCCIRRMRKQRSSPRMEPGVVARTLLPYCFADFADPRRTHHANPSSCSSVASRIRRTSTAALWFVEHVLPRSERACRVRDSSSSDPIRRQRCSLWPVEAISVRANVSDANCASCTALRASLSCRCATAPA